MSAPTDHSEQASKLSASASRDVPPGPGKANPSRGTPQAKRRPGSRVNILPAAQQPTRFCLGCRHPLHGLGQDTHRCPECGREFEPGNPRTFSKYPYGERWAALAQTTRTFIKFSMACTALAFFMSAFGFDLKWQLMCVMLPMMAAIMLVPAQIIVIWIAQSVGGWQALSRKWMIAGPATIALFMSMMITQWPLRLNFLLHRPWLERAAETFALQAPPQPRDYTTLSRSTRIGLLHFRRVTMLHNGNIGFQLSGDDGEGTLFVRTSPQGEDRVWSNSIVHALSDNWHLAHEE